MLVSLHEFRTHSTSWWLGISAQGICIPAVAVGTLPSDRISSSEGYMRSLPDALGIATN
jgi:hypothetical protein